MAEYWSVAVDAPIREPLTYQAPDSLAGGLFRGQRVKLPLGKRQTTGVLLRPQKDVPDVKLKEISELDDTHPTLPDFFLKWLEWLAEYYLHPVGTVASLAYPSLSKATKERKSKRPPPIKEYAQSQAPRLTDEQQTVINKISEQKGFSTHLLFGVTGSGKTEVYLQLLDKTLNEGKRGLVLVPEISLTPQLIQRFAARFGNRIAVLHSQLTDRERTNQWWDIVEGRKDILIGARSALFCPVQNLGLIIVDEEHEPSYKQDEKLKYHGRDAAIMLAKLVGCPIILGSATPSLESWRNALEGRFHLHEMKKRVEDRSLPEVRIIDLKANENKNKSLPHWLSQELADQIQETLERKEQVALFLNRRGMAPLVICQDCGFVHECPNCDISLTLHGKNHLVCHYCDYHETMKDHCPDCKEGHLSSVGLGTEQLETEIQRLFPEAKIARADRDEITNRADLEELIEQMETKEIDILIGTQMIAKGLDFPHLTLVGLILVDVGFNLPDFRATERSFQLITQVSGRAGRHIKVGERPGQVIVQTYNPDHPSLLFAQHADFRGFASMELEHRQVLNYPPIGKLISIRIQGTSLSKVQETSRLCSQRGQQLVRQYNVYENIEVLGPAEAPLSKLRGQHRYHILLKGLESRIINQFCRQLFGDESWVPSGIRLSADVDPIHLL
ncbi:MAG: hypothetical protein BroJett040_10430 [Oligoflexia bacterium]|nr:MAG: hypothetical protein BroJett040_10430 [Oligoflexia bacterium]